MNCEIIRFTYEGGVARRALHRTRKLNTCPVAMPAGVRAALADLRAETWAGVQMLTRAGRAFCAWGRRVHTAQAEEVDVQRGARHSSPEPGR